MVQAEEAEITVLQEVMAEVAVGTAAVMTVQLMLEDKAELALEETGRMAKLYSKDPEEVEVQVTLVEELSFFT